MSNPTHGLVHPQLTKYSYVQFHQLVYLLKLYIEMNAASLLGHIVKSSREQDANPQTGRKIRDDLANGRITTLVTANRTGHVRLADQSCDNSYQERVEWENGIVKKVETKIEFNDPESQKGASQHIDTFP